MAGRRNRERVTAHGHEAVDGGGGGGVGGGDGKLMLPAIER